MQFLKIILIPFVLLVLWTGAPTLMQAAQPDSASQPRTARPAAQDEYVPLSELPPDEQLPAVPLVFIAYGLIWLAVLVYVITIWRRQSAVEKELEVVKRQLRS